MKYYTSMFKLLPIKLRYSERKLITRILLTNYYIISKTEQICKLLPSSCKKNTPLSPDASTHHSHKRWPEESLALHSLKMTDGVMLSFCI